MRGRDFKREWGGVGLRIDPSVYGATTRGAWTALSDVAVELRHGVVCVYARGTAGGLEAARWGLPTVTSPLEGLRSGVDLSRL